jgi:hypothetical protein
VQIEKEELQVATIINTGDFRKRITITPELVRENIWKYKGIEVERGKLPTGENGSIRDEAKNELLWCASRVALAVITAAAVNASEIRALPGGCTTEIRVSRDVKMGTVTDRIAMALREADIPFFRDDHAGYTGGSMWHHFNLIFNDNNGGLYVRIH